MIKMRCSGIAICLQGKLTGPDVDINAVSTDSRAISAGSLFIALKGPHYDGAAFIDDVIQKGAVAVVVSQPVARNITQIIVEDTRLALGQLGAEVKRRVAPKTIAVTGSAGKTTVKEMLAAILQQKGKTLATAGNLNNDIGVPLTLLQLTEQHQFAVLELGANHPGEIAYTTSLVKPDVALITNVAPSHLDGFGDVFGVARAKSEIFSGLTTGGTAIIPADSQYAEYWQQRLGDIAAVTFSSEKAADFYAQNIELDAQGRAAFELHTPQGKIAIKLTLPGKHNVVNALAAASASIAIGADLQDIKQGLERLQPVKGRTTILQLNSKLRLIDDTYNANVQSVKAAIDLLASYPGLRVLLLGDMAELGAEARLYHEEIGLYAKQAGINLLFTLGVLSQSASDLFNEQGAHFSSRQALINHLNPILSTPQQEITLLVKGSRSASMELVVQDLLAVHQREDGIC